MSSLSMMANAIRILSMDAVEKAASGHPGMPMGMADVMTVLFSEFIKHSPQDPAWPDRDRFVLSAGHGCLLLYSTLYLLGYESMTLEQLKSFRQWESLAAGHPEHSAGIETTTGPLAQGLANGIGMAFAEAMLRKEFGADLVDHRTYIVVSDGCLMEGLSQEAISLAGHLGLDRVVVLFDDNHISIDGGTNLSCSDDVLQRFQASQWDTYQIDGHDHDQIRKALQAAQHQKRPSLIACRTQIGYGAPHKANTSAAHGAPLGADEVAATRKALGWPLSTPFEVPQDLLNAWRAAGQRSHALYQAWHERFQSSPRREELTQRLCGALDEKADQALASLKKHFEEKAPAQATRKTSGQILQELAPSVPFVLGSADLGESTQILPQGSVFSKESPGRYIHYGVREHAMAALMNGIALHKGFIPCGGTFLIFSDYCRPAIRLSALMGLHVIYIMTHDSIGLGEDGPTHQPIEHLASLRAVPNLYVFRPADAVETVECWELALQMQEGPSILCLTRQNVPPVRQAATSKNRCAQGAYVLSAPLGDVPYEVDLWATGSEVSLALQIQDLLASCGRTSRVISAPCWRLFDRQPLTFQKALRHSSALKVSIEAASPLGWERYVGNDGLIIGLDRFGASAPYQDIYRHLGLTSEKILASILDRLQS